MKLAANLVGLVAANFMITGEGRPGGMLGGPIT
jgi:hypothetical protein